MSSPLRFLFLLIFSVVSSQGRTQTILYSESFTSGFPASWNSFDSTGGGNWIYTTTPTLRLGTSASGVMRFDSESFGNDGFPELAKIVSPAINCSSAGKVFLSFNHLFRQFTNSKGRVYVSKDSINWVNVFQQSVNSRNPDSVILDVSSIAANENKVFLMFEYTGDWDLFWELDDVMLFVPRNADIAVSNILLDEFLLPGNHFVDYTLTNHGASFIDSAIIECNIDGYSLYDTLSDVFLPANYFINKRFPIPIWIPDAKEHVVRITANLISPLTDAYLLNNTLELPVSGLSSKVNKNVLLEVFSSMNDGFCPIVPSMLDSIGDSLPYVSSVVHHFSDVYEITESNVLRSNLSLNTAPSALINRKIKLSEDEADRPASEWFRRCEEERSEFSPVSFSMKVLYDSTTRIASVIMKGMFHGVVQREPRLLLQITQKNIWEDQRNSFHMNPSFVTSPFYVLPSILDSFPQPEILISSPSGIYGNNASISFPTVDSQTFFYVFTYLVPAGIQPGSLTFTGSVCAFESNVYRREIYNTLSNGINDSSKISPSPLNYTTITETQHKTFDCFYFPNPVVEELQLRCDEPFPTEIFVTNSYGQVLAHFKNFPSQIDMREFAKGIYFLRLVYEQDEVQTKKVLKD